MVLANPDTMARAKMSSPLDMLETSCTRLVRRVVNLPRAISRVVDQGLDLMTAAGGRRNHHQFPPPSVPLHHHPPPYQPTNNFQSNWDFLAGFEQQFGVTHPFFYACRFVEVLKMAQDEHKFVFLYLHSPDHPFTPPFCKDTLCAEVVVQFLDANFMSWGGVANVGEGMHLAAAVQPTTFPFCAIVARGSDDSLVVVQKMEGPVTPEELVETLQTTLEEQGLAFDNARVDKEEKRRDDIRLRQEQDAAYSASLQADQEKALIRKKKPQHQDNANPNTQDVQILIRFPNGERKQRVFSLKDKIEAIFKFINSLGLPEVGKNYRLVSSFPRKVYGVDQMQMSLKDAEFGTEATLFIELV
ncbi:putative UBX domain, Ubiquitin-like domain superfamily, Thioredoxin-like superfamily [Helianthus annuus]|nr:putative UBX domain, Ubiquitin-like domain superfamily, Thioredoxin-like superfamily [Helianthus annuus]